MKPFTASELLNVWEQGLNRSMLQRALFLLGAAHPDRDQNDMARLSIGTRDTLLIELRARLFGSHMVNTVVCPQCAERVEWENDIADIQLPAAVTEFDSESHQHHLETDGYRVNFRLPNSMDIAEILSAEASDDAQQALLERCIVDAHRANEGCEVSKLPQPVLAAIGQRMEELDPSAEIHIQLTCPKCSFDWKVLFDIATFLWTEIDRWAERMLHTVHQLACAYGWSETQVLNLSPVRRALYLQLVRS